LKDRDSSDAGEEGADEVPGGLGRVGGLRLGCIGGRWLLVDDSHGSEFVVAVDVHRGLSSSIRLIFDLGSDGRLEHILEDVEKRSESVLKLKKKKRRRRRRDEVSFKFASERDEIINSRLSSST